MSATSNISEDWLTLRERLEALDVVVYNAEPYKFGIVIDLNEGRHILTWEDRKSGFVLSLQNLDTLVQLQLGKSSVLCYLLKTKLTNKREQQHRLISMLGNKNKKKRRFSLKSKSIDVSIWDLFTRVKGEYIREIPGEDGCLILSKLYSYLNIGKIENLDTNPEYECVHVLSSGYSPRPWLF